MGTPDDMGQGDFPQSGSGPLSEADPHQIGPYRLQRRLGSGGMGVVFLALSPTGRQVALKRIRPELADQAGFRARFRREVEAGRAVMGSGTVRYLDADLEGEPAYLVTEYVHGTDLADLISNGGPLVGSSLHRLTLGLADALNSLHRAGVVHRDLKPSNILVSDDGWPTVIDFGISHALEDISLTQSGVLIGSPTWMAPEQVQGNAVTPAVDVFAWGSLVAFAATGRPPFGLGRSEAVLYRVVHAEPDLQGVEASLREVVSAALAKDPSLRPTAPQLLVTLTNLVGVPARSRVPPGAESEVASPIAPAHIAARPPEAEGDISPSVPAEVSGRTTTIVAPYSPTTSGDSFADQPSHDPPARPWVSGRRRQMIAGVVAATIVAGTAIGIAVAKNLVPTSSPMSSSGITSSSTNSGVANTSPAGTPPSRPASTASATSHATATPWPFTVQPEDCQALTHATDGSVSPVVCADGRPNLEAVLFFQSFQSQLLGLPAQANTEQVDQAACADLASGSGGGTIPIVTDEAELAWAENGWSFPNLSPQGLSTSMVNGLCNPATPTPQAPPTVAGYTVCQLSVAGKEARITVGGNGISTSACTALIPYLHHNTWDLVPNPPSQLPTTAIICNVPNSLLPAGAQGVVSDTGFFSTSTGNNACTDLSQAGG